MVVGNFRDLFAALAASAASLTGLLFVAISVAPNRPEGTRPAVIEEVRAAASFISFTNVLAVSLFGLVPGNDIGYPAMVVGLAGLAFTAAGARSILGDPAARPHRRRQLLLITLLLATFGVECGAGIRLVVGSSARGPIELIGDCLAASVLIGVARAWELVGARDTGIFTSLAVLAGLHRGRPTEGAPGVPAPQETPPAP
jgi:hypothetical protein